MFALVFCWLLLAASTFAADAPYDPLALTERAKSTLLDLTVIDQKRGREIPLRVFLPAQRTPAPVVLFSHGLGDSRAGNAFMGQHWATRGYVAVFLQHPGSDTAVWAEHPQGQRMRSMEQAAGAQNYLLRVKDVPAVLDQLERWNKSEGQALAGRLDLARIGMSGHSFGAVTAQAVSGQSTERGRMPFTDPRIKAAILFSPSGPRRGGNPKASFEQVKIPWLLMTGTKDTAAIGGTDLNSRLSVYPALPPGGKYELVLFGAEHSAFTERALPGDTEQRNPNHHRAILAITTAFWDAWLRGDAAAKAWLDGDGARSVLQANDRWQRK